MVGDREVEYGRVRTLLSHRPFLRPHGTASKDGRADFAPFIFNHRVDGTIAALRGDSRELFLIIADNNDITTRALVAGDPELW